MGTIEDLPRRYALANELHARPFPPLEAPARAAYLAAVLATQALVIPLHAVGAARGARRSGS